MYKDCTEAALPSLTTTIFPLRSALGTVIGNIKTLLRLNSLVWIGWVTHSLTHSLTHSPTGGVRVVVFL